ncbi:MAG: hypothetical protein ACHP7N_15475 [Caulobacterales bacterium]
MMRAAVLAAMALFPLVALAGPRSAPAETPGAVYSVRPPAAAGSEPTGWALSVTAKGRTVDLRRRGSAWIDDPDVRPGDVEAGLGWRGESTSVVVGYAERDFGPALQSMPAYQPRTHWGPVDDPPGVLGLSVSLRSR